MTDDLRLNEEQLKAVRHKTGPLLIIAGAGTGKTTVITERIKYLITAFKKTPKSELGDELNADMSSSVRGNPALQSGEDVIEKNLAKPSEILALTFTEKAAREMETRVDEAMPYGYTQMWISTFHSFCDRVLREKSLHIGYDPKYKLMTEAEAIQLIRKNLFKFDLDYFRPLGNPNKFISGMLQHFSRLQDEDVNPSEYLTWVNSNYQFPNSKLDTEQKLELQKYKELAGAYKTYDELKTKEGFFDFGDLIIKTLQLFRQRKNVLGQYQKQFKYILVDEFQDTNIAQYSLLKLLVPPKENANLTVVGDDLQSIYKFRGAAISNILYFKKDYKKAKSVVLTKNYRSTQEILDSAYRLARFNAPDTLEDKLGIDKNLVSVRNPKEKEEIKFIHADRVENEAEAVAGEILRLIAQDKYQYKDFAVLVRANNHAEPFTRALSRHGIPYQFLGPGRLFKQPEIVDLISYLKVLYNFEDSVSFFRLLSIDYFDVSVKDISLIGNWARRKNISLFEVCEHLDETSASQSAKEKIQKLVGLINKNLRLVRKETAGQLLYYFLEETGLMQKLLSPDTPDAEKRAINISKFFDKLKTYEVDHEDATVPVVVDWIELASELGESPLAADMDWTEINAVNILTVHSAKGLEFPVVFLVNLVGQRFPTSERREQIPIPDGLIKEILPKGDYHLQEERRLFYVGMTRAMNELYFTAADYYGEGKREKKLSPFIFEALGDSVTAAEDKIDKSQQLSFLDYQPSSRLRPASEPQTPHLDYLSVSQIETFKVCPLHYKLKYIYKVPTPTSAAQSFGIAVHSTLKNFYEILKKEPHFAKASRGLEKLMFNCYKTNWIDDGYLSKSHEEKFFEKGKIYLKGFLKEGFNPKIIPMVTEQPFTVPLKIDSPSKSSGRSLRIGGKIDRVDILADGSIEIIDYKTGATIPGQKEVDRDLQLSFYALAASIIKEDPFARNPEDIKLSLYFLDTQEKISTVRTRKQLEDAIKEIFEWREKIEKSDFICSGGILCKNCEYKLLCNSD